MTLLEETRLHIANINSTLIRTRRTLTTSRLLIALLSENERLTRIVNATASKPMQRAAGGEDEEVCDTRFYNND